MTRAYIRVDPGFYERKAVDQGYPPGAVAALVGCFCLAESQPTRGRFRDRKLLGVLLGPQARWIPFLIEHGDLSERDALPRLYVEGWAEWQEGDVTVHERMARLRAKRNGVTPPVTGGVTPVVTVPVTTDRQTAAVEAEAVSGKRKAQDGDGGPLRPPRSMTDDERTEAIAANRRLLGSDQVEVQRAAQRALRRLDPDTDWGAELASAAAVPPSPTPRPRSAASG